MLTAHLKNTQKDFSQCLKDSGFTLIELLIVITIIGALAVTVFVALNPVKRVKDAHDARRASDVETQLTAIHEYVVDNNGNLPPALPAVGNTYTISGGAACAGGVCNTVAGLVAANYSPTTGSVGFGCGAASAGSQVTNATLTTQLAAYLKAIPTDPLYSATWASTGYAIGVATGNIVTVTACFPEDIFAPATGISQSR